MTEGEVYKSCVTTCRASSVQMGKDPVKTEEGGRENTTASNNNGIALSKQFSFAQILAKAGAVGVSSFGPRYCCLGHFN